jgi:hypothetical protein
VTVEAALALCSLMVVLALAIGAVASVAAQLRCTDAAREAARLVARGEPDRARQVAEAIAPRGARLDLGLRGDEVTATVTAAAVGGLPGLTVSGRALGVLEPGVVAGGSARVPAAPAGGVEGPPEDVGADGGALADVGGTSATDPAVSSGRGARTDGGPIEGGSAAGTRDGRANR